MILKAKVEQDMPYLTVHVLPADTMSSVEIDENKQIVLEGQISQWILRVANIGTAAATNVTLKTNVPWVNIADNDAGGRKSSAMDSNRTSNCVGPTGTLMNLPIKGGKGQGVIGTGETVDIPFFLRTTGTGEQEFYMLYRYEVWDPSSSVKRSRWIRKSVHVPIYPSLSLNATMMPSSWKNDEHILSVEVSAAAFPPFGCLGVVWAFQFYIDLILLFILSCCCRLQIKGAIARSILKPHWTK